MTRNRPLAMLVIMLPLLAGAPVACRDANSVDRQGLLMAGDEAFDNGSKRPPTPATLYALARLLAGQGHDGRAAILLTRITREHPAFLPAYCDLAEAYLRHGRYDQAMATLEAGLKLTPHDPLLHNNLGMCLMLQGHHGRAFEAFSRAAAAAPGDARYAANAAMALALQGRYDEALQRYRQILPAADAAHNLAVLSAARGDTPAAERFARLAQPPTAATP